MPAPPPPGYNPAQDVERIRKATKGFGTDEGALIATLAPLDAYQIDALRNTFKATVGKDLLQVLEKETSGWFEAALRAKVLGPVLYDCWLIKRACKVLVHMKTCSTKSSSENQPGDVHPQTGLPSHLW